MIAGYEDELNKVLGSLNNKINNTLSSYTSNAGSNMGGTGIGEFQQVLTAIEKEFERAESLVKTLDVESRSAGSSADGKRLVVNPYLYFALRSSAIA